MFSDQGVGGSLIGYTQVSLNQIDLASFSFSLNQVYIS